MVKVPVSGKFCKEGTGKLGAIVAVQWLWYAMLSINSSFRVDIILEALHWDRGILQMKGIFE